MKNVIPLGSMVLVRPFLAADKVKGGLVLPSDVKQDRPDSGTVAACGPEAGRVQPGDKVILNRYSADEALIEEDGVDVKYLLLEESEIFAKFE